MMVDKLTSNDEVPCTLKLSTVDEVKAGHSSGRKHNGADQVD